MITMVIDGRKPLIKVKKTPAFRHFLRPHRALVYKLFYNFAAKFHLNTYYHGKTYQRNTRTEGERRGAL